MKILCAIDSLGSGGAQRQMVHLACGLKAKGHDVELLVYFSDLRFFRSELDTAGIRVHEVRKGKGFSFKVLGKLFVLIRSGNFDAVISFLVVPNIYVEIAKLLARSSKTKVVVSERSSYTRESGTLKQRFARYLHACSDGVVANSHSHAEWLRRYSWLRHKVHVVYNGYPISAPKERLLRTSQNRVPKLLIVGRIDAGKNGVRLIEALVLFYKKNGYLPTLAWAGRQETNLKALKSREEMDHLLGLNPQVERRWFWLGERNDIFKLMEGCDALVHVSLFEGLPNVICEAFIAGRPVIASNVCDHPLLVKDGIRGVMCDPLSPESICDAIERFSGMSDAERILLGQNARKYAEEYLTIDRMVGEYEAILYAETD